MYAMQSNSLDDQFLLIQTERMVKKKKKKQSA